MNPLRYCIMEFSDLTLPIMDTNKFIAYRKARFQFFLSPIRGAVLMATILYLLFFLWDMSFHGALILITFSIRLAFVLLAGIAFFTTYTTIFREHHQAFLVLLGTVAGIGVVAILHCIPNGFTFGISGMCLVIMYTCTLFFLEVNYAIIANLLIICTTNIGLSVSEHSSPAWQVALNANFFMLSFSIASVMTNYSIEHNLRHRFIIEGTLTPPGIKGAKFHPIIQSPANRQSDKYDDYLVLAEITRVFSERDDAIRLAESSGFPKGRMPQFTTSLAFWSKVANEAYNGVLPKGIEPIIKEAIALYPKNTVFLQYHKPREPCTTDDAISPEEFS